MDIDALQDKIGGMSKYQMVLVISVSLYTWTEFMNQTTVFFSAVPKHRCFIEGVDDDTTGRQNMSEMETINKSITFAEESSCRKYGSDNCSITAENDTGCVITPCNKYVYDTSLYETTTISEWDLVCDRRILDTVAISVYYAGVAIGSVFTGQLTDRVGRKQSMLIFCINIILFGMLSSYATNFPLYVCSRFLVGLSDTIYLAALAYVSEIVDLKHRTHATNYLVLFGALAHVLLPGIAYVTRDWRTLGAVASLIPSIYLIVYFFIPESPRWLIANGRAPEARFFFERCAKSNGTVLLEKNWVEAVRNERKKHGMKKTHSYKHLFRGKYIRVITFNVMFCFFALNLVFEGLVVNVTNLAGDPYMNAFLNALVEFFGCLAYVIIITNFNKKRLLLCVGFLLTGVYCILSTIFSETAFENKVMQNASAGFAITGKFFATVVYALIYILSNELYPTTLRGTGMAAGSVASGLGAVTMPFVLLLQVKVSWLTQTVFGIVAICASATSLIFPDTSRIPMLDGVKDAEKYYAQNMKLLQRMLVRQAARTQGAPRLEKQQIGLIGKRVFARTF